MARKDSTYETPGEKAHRIALAHLVRRARQWTKAVAYEPVGASLTGLRQAVWDLNRATKDRARERRGAAK